MVATLILGYDITAIVGKVITIPSDPEARRSVSGGAGKPSDEFAELPVKVGRRKGMWCGSLRFRRRVARR